MASWFTLKALIYFKTDTDADADAETQTHMTTLHILRKTIYAKEEFSYSK